MQSELLYIFGINFYFSSARLLAFSTNFILLYFLRIVWVKICHGILFFHSHFPVFLMNRIKLVLSVFLDKKTSRKL